MHICVGGDNSNHNHFEGEIVYIKMHEQHLYKGMFVSVINTNIRHHLLINGIHP
jgi:hypothetical protein